MITFVPCTPNTAAETGRDEPFGIGIDGPEGVGRAVGARSKLSDGTVAEYRLDTVDKEVLECGACGVLDVASDMEGLAAICVAAVDRLRRDPEYD